MAQIHNWRPLNMSSPLFPSFHLRPAVDICADQNTVDQSSSLPFVPGRSELRSFSHKHPTSVVVFSDNLDFIRRMPNQSSFVLIMDIVLLKYMLGWCWVGFVQTKAPEKILYSFIRNCCSKLGERATSYKFFPASRCSCTIDPQYARIRNTVGNSYCLCSLRFIVAH
jgi:hypothetical protein